jgi:hypothetical protein
VADRARKEGKERKPQTPRRLMWRRVPSRVLLMIAFVAGIAALVLGVFPFDAADGDRTLSCGPPLFEVIVPADGAFDVPENTGCPEPAKQRVVLSGILFGAVFVIAVITQIRARRLTALSHERWLEGPRRRPSRGERKRELTPPG